MYLLLNGCGGVFLLLKCICGTAVVILCRTHKPGNNSWRTFKVTKIDCKRDPDLQRAINRK
ncbi:hypothetical protein SAMN02745181_2518 [Rubritalea squalenifaciens DSM 18772]|uniref:Uncharacterized protein n=1 Tax=Rubritalea squalenifaciens DSM 18772 TaxID=1123071 RepID=A0A1M6LVU0_9BACT|nr:hypothetical protein SAMN02745181_2518 [Rubritalea squalenifaciens DSM 18772]